MENVQLLTVFLACSFTISGLISPECHDTAPVSQKADISYQFRPHYIHTLKKHSLKSVCGMIYRIGMLQQDEIFI